jgi:natural product biosynthesis luciferase-like monooxygenase protein
MKLGLNFFPSFTREDATTAQYYDQCIRLAVRADELGLNSIKTVEHSFYDYGGHSPNPSVFLAAVAARTKRIRIITGAVIPAFHHPAHLGGDLAMLDNLSNGRLDAGFGRAFLPKEFEVFGVPLSESRGRFEEGIQLIQRLWTEDRVTAQGKYWQFEDVHLMPRCVQQPHPPIWLAAISSKESFDFAARHGYNLMIVPYASKPGMLAQLVSDYRKDWIGYGHKAGTEQIQVAAHCYIAEDRDEAMAGFRRITQRYIQTFGEAVESWQGKTSDQYPGYDKLVASILATTPESMLAQNAAYVGTPDDVIAQIQKTIAELGTVEPSMQINFGGSSDAEAFRTLELLATKVMPRLP